MDSGIIAAFVASGFAVLTSIINIVVSSINAKKDSNIEVIVKTRIIYLQELRYVNAKFISMVNLNLISNNTKKKELFIIKDFLESVSKLKTLLKPFYPIEKRMIELTDSIENDTITLFNCDVDNDLIVKLKNDIMIYTKLFNQYDWVYWQYIIKQADGRFKNSNSDFDEIYEENKLKYMKEYNYEWI
jgi:bifunctional ADP-heptose synthase (sugar kinase/adenylyltransferase)